VSVSVVAVATISNNGTFTPSVSGTWPPTGVSVGDIALLYTVSYNRGKTCPTPTTGGVNWTAIDTTYVHTRLYAHAIAASEAAPNISSGSNTYLDIGICFLHWTGATPPAVASLLNAAAVWNVGSAQTNMPFSSLAAPSVNGCLPMLFGAFPEASTSIAAPSQYSTLILQDSLATSVYLSSLLANAALQGTAASVASGSATVSGGGTNANYPFAAVFAIAPGTSLGGITITGLTASSIKPGQTGFVITGTGFAGAGDTVQIIDGTNAVSQTVTGDTTTAITITCVQGNLRYGALTLKVTSGANTATVAITLAPNAGISYVNCPTLRLLTTTPQIGGLATPSRINDTPTDISNGSQIEYQVASGSGTLTIDPDGRVSWAVAVKSMSWRWIAGTGAGTWTSLYTWGLVGLFPGFVGATIGTQTYQQNAAITALNVAALFSEPDPLETPLTYSSVGTALPTGLSLVSGQIQGTPTVNGTTAGIQIQAQDQDGSQAVTNTFSIVVQASGTTFQGTIPAQAATVGTAFSLSVASFFSGATSYTDSSTLPPGLSINNAGLISGTPTGAGIPVGGSTPYSVTITANPGAVASNTFTITVTNPTASVTVPTLASPSTQAAASAALTGVGLTASFPVPWTGSVAIVQSIPGGTLVAAGTTVAVTPSTGVVVSVSSAISGNLAVLVPAYQANSTDIELLYTCTLGASDLTGSQYRFFRIGSNTIVEDIEIYHASVGSGTAYALGLYYPTTLNYGAVPAAGAQGVFTQAPLSLDASLSGFVSVYAPVLLNPPTPAVFPNTQPVWVLLGFTSDPQVLFDVTLTALTPGAIGGAVQLYMRYQRGNRYANLRQM
jgi:large repetitive protein